MYLNFADTREWRTRATSAAEAVSSIRPGDHVFVGTACATPADPRGRARAARQAAGRRRPDALPGRPGRIVRNALPASVLLRREGHQGNARAHPARVPGALAGGCAGAAEAAAGCPWTWP